MLMMALPICSSLPPISHTMEAAAAVAAELRKNYLEGCVGATYPVLFEQPKEDWFFGHAPNYAEVLVKGTDLHNEIRPVTVTSADGEFLYGTIKE